MRPVALVTGDFVQTGGMDVANFHLARYLASTGTEVHLVAHRVDPELLAMPQIRWHRVRKPLNSYLLGSRALARAGRRWGRAVTAAGGRVVVNGGNCASVATNWVHYVHAGHRPPISGPATRRLLAAWKFGRYVREERTALQQAPLVIANSDATARDIVAGAGVSESRVHTVYYGTDGGYHRPPTGEERHAARAALGWHDERPGVAFVGALGDRRKGFDVLFEAWRLLCADPAWSARLVVAGTGAELPAWQRAAAGAGLAERVVFLGFTRDVRSMLWGCDVIAAPARYEAYGLAVHEGVCCGLPAVVSPGTGVAERLTGLEELQPNRGEDPAALAEALRRWYRDRPRWSAVAATLSGQLRSWSWNDMSAKIVHLMESAT